MLFPGVLAAIGSSVIACKVLCLWAVVNVDVVKILVKVGKEGPVSTFLSFWSLLICRTDLLCSCIVSICFVIKHMYEFTKLLLI